MWLSKPSAVSLEEHTYNEILNMKILDPACGSGSFLIRAYDELLSYHAKVQGKSVADLSWQERIRILTANIFGVDLDPQAVEIARLNLLIRALAQRELLPSLEQNVQCGNSLIFGRDKQLETALGANFRDYKPFNWDERFASIIYLGGFDVIIGNPPYVMELRDNKEIFRQLRNTPFGNKYYEPKMDLFYFFIELGIDLLKDGGYLGFIVQQYWASRAHASKLRRKIFDETCPVVLVDLNEYKVFQDAPGQHNMIIVLEKTKNKHHETLLLNLKESNVGEHEIIKALASDTREQSIFDARTVETKKLYDAKTDKVHVVGDAVSDLLVKLAKNSFNLHRTEIQQGIVTPQHFLSSSALAEMENPENHRVGEGIFVLTKAEAQKLKLSKKEQRLLRPFHYAEEIDSYYYDSEFEHYLIYTPVKTAKDIESNPLKYPNIRSHLDKYQAVITSDHRPYGIHRARQPEWFEDRQKIIGVRKTSYPKFAVVPEVWYGDQAILIIRPVQHKNISPHFIAAILNSKVAHFWLFQQKRQGNQLQIDKEVLLNFPFSRIDLSTEANRELHDKIVMLAKAIARQRKEIEKERGSGQDLFGEKTKEIQSQIARTEYQLNHLVYQLYRLNENEIREIEGVAQ
ncbi:MAG: hypothetical protein FJ008_06495 [Chloroflexi bacterium]|nr:hypothetical protein [Chloroflexota bacterium]